MCYPQKSLREASFCVAASFSLFVQVFGGLQPYYLNFPPPVLTVPNDLGDFSYSTWSQRNNDNFTRTGNLPSGPIPLILHTWVKPDNSEGTKLQNGSVVYYLGGPWGGIRTNTPGATDMPVLSQTPVSNNLSDLRSSSVSPTTGGWAKIDITTPPPPRQQTGPWGHGHLGFGWPSSTQLYDKIPETSTSVPTRTQQNTSTTSTTTNKPANFETTTSTRTTTSAQTTTTVDPVAENTNSRFPVSDSVRKFRRIVAQIRAITKKELGAESREARREQRRRERLLRNRTNNNY